MAHERFLRASRPLSFSQSNPIRITTMHMQRFFLPVGQGAFYLERFWLQEHEHPINVVYDCGAVIEQSTARDIQCNQSNMECIIKRVFQKGETIHAVYLSHLHEDHVNGLQALCKWCKVNKVFFPLIAKDDLSLMRLQDWMRNNAEGSIARQLIDFSENNRRPEMDPGPEQWIPVPATENGERPPERQDNAYNFLPSIMGHSLSSGSSFRNWAFIHYNFREQSRIEKLKDALRKELQLSEDELQSDLNNDSLLSRWNDKESREKIKQAYKSIPGQFNTNSMTLFSGDCTESLQQISLHQEYLLHWHSPLSCQSFPLADFYCNNRSTASGCLYTGDYDAKGSNKWTMLKNHYRRCWNSIGCVQIPHHGSRHSFNDALCECDAFFVISSGLGNHYHHPHAEVVAALRAKKRLFAEVTQAPFSIFSTLVR